MNTKVQSIFQKSKGSKEPGYYCPDLSCKYKYKQNAVTYVSNCIDCIPKTKVDEIYRYCKLLQLINVK